MDHDPELLKQLFERLTNSGTTPIELYEAKKTFGELILLNDLLKRKEPNEARCSVCECARQLRISASGSSAYYSLPVDVAELFLRISGFVNTEALSEICLRCSTICRTSVWKREEE